MAPITDRIRLRRPDADKTSAGCTHHRAAFWPCRPAARGESRDARNRSTPSSAATAIRSCSIFSAVISRVRPSRRVIRVTWVSTTTPVALPIRRAQDDVGRLASDSRQFHQQLHLDRDFPVVSIDQLLAAGLDALGLAAKEPGALDFLFELGQRQRGKVGCDGILAKQRPRHDVHPLVSTLGGQNRGDQQLQGIVVFQGATWHPGRRGATLGRPVRRDASRESTRPWKLPQYSG